MTESPSKVVLITGASSGFGYATANLLTQRGYRVFGTSRNPSKPIDSHKFEILQLDVDSDESARACVDTLLQRTAGHIDILINNAGFVFSGSVEETSIGEAKQQLETNLFGAVRMVDAVLPLMRKQKGGRIVNIGSLAGFIPVPFQGFYAASKFALEGYTEQLRQETKSLGIKVSIVEPGFFRTNIEKNARSASAKIDDYDRMRQNALTELWKRAAKGQDPIMVAETIARLIESKNPKLHYAVGRDAWGLLVKRLLPQTTFEGGVRRIFKLDSRS